MSFLCYSNGNYFTFYSSNCTFTKSTYSFKILLSSDNLLMFLTSLLNFKLLDILTLSNSDCYDFDFSYNWAFSFSKA
jgi:hypothetical protein